MTARLAHGPPMQELHDLELLLTSRTPIVLIESLEEPRLIHLFTRLALRLSRPMFQWTITEGLQRLELQLAPQPTTKDPSQLLRHIKATSTDGFYLLLDFHPYLQDPLHIRLLKEIAQGYEQLAKTLILISHAIETPPELKHLTARFELQLPDQAALTRMIREEAGGWQRRTGRQLRADNGAVQRLASNLVGVTASDARRLIRSAIENDGAIGHADLKKVAKAKYDLIGQDGVVSFEYDTARFSDVAGLERLKDWLQHRQGAFAGKHPTLDPPKGILLLGVQGGGKSLAAKAVAGSFGVPLLRLDFANLYNKYIGESEKNLRRALATAETMAPCVLWVDEIEKGLAQGNTDDGVSQRLLGTLLTWMAEQKGRVFIVATANDIRKLPPELIRKGRLDELFFVDLPRVEVRREIFSIHLRQRNLAPGNFDLDALAAASRGFTGAEIEQVVVSAIYVAQSRENGLSTDLLLEELERTSPLSVVMAEQIDYLREWAANRTVPAD